MAYARMRGLAIVRLALDADETSHPSELPEETYEAFTKALESIKETLDDAEGFEDISVEVEIMSTIEVEEDAEEEDEDDPSALDEEETAADEAAVEEETDAEEEGANSGLVI